LENVGIFVVACGLELLRPIKLGTRRSYKGMIAKSFAAEVERRRGANSGGSSNGKV
jgi:hypothetical protein